MDLKGSGVKELTCGEGNAVYLPLPLDIEIEIEPVLASVLQNGACWGHGNSDIELLDLRVIRVDAQKDGVVFKVKV